MSDPNRPAGPGALRRPSQRPTRRRFVQGVAWAAPTLVATTAAPAFAASTCTPDPGSTVTAQLGFGDKQDGNGWVGGSSGSFYGTPTVPVWMATYTQPSSSGMTGCRRTAPTNSFSFASPGGVVVGQPDPSSATSVLTYSRKLCLQAGTYNAAFDWRTLTYNAVGSTVQLSATPEGGSTQNIGGQVIAPAGSTTAANDYGSGTMSGTLGVLFARPYTIRFTFSFTAASSYGSLNSCATFANDIAVSSPRFTRR